jgi:hypothetical protein
MSEEPIQVLLPPALRGPFEEWLHRRNLELVPLEAAGPAQEDDLPTYFIGLA